MGSVYASGYSRNAVAAAGGINTALHMYDMSICDHFFVVRGLTGLSGTEIEHMQMQLKKL